MAPLCAAIDFIAALIIAIAISSEVPVVTYLPSTRACSPAIRRLIAVHPALDTGLDADDLLAPAAAAETGSEHPLCAALVVAARERSLTLPTLTGFDAVPGHGLRATDASHSVLIGNDRLLAGLDVDPLRLTAEAAAQDGATRSTSRLTDTQ